MVRLAFICMEKLHTKRLSTEGRLPRALIAYNAGHCKNPYCLMPSSLPFNTCWFLFTYNK